MIAFLYKVIISWISLEKIEYRKRKDRIKLFIPFYNKYCYLLKKGVIMMLYILCCAVLYPLIKGNFLNVGYVLLVLALIMSFQSFMAYAQIDLLNEKYNLIEYSNCGFFSESEKKNNNKVMYLLLLIMNGGIGVGLILFVELINIMYTKDNIINYVCLGVFSILIYLYQLLIEYNKWIERNIKSDNYEDGYLWICISTIVLLFVKINNVKINILKLDECKRALDYIINSKLWFWTLLGIIAYILINKIMLLVQNKRTYYCFSNIKKEFYYKEVKGKITFYNIVLLLFVLFDKTSISCNLIMVVLVSFLFTIYNNRFLLNDSFLNYYYMINNKNLFMKLSIETIIFPLLAIVYGTLILNNQASGILRSMLLGVLLLLFNKISNTFAYQYFFRTKAEDKQKQDFIEIINGFMYIFEIIILVGLS